MIIRSPAIETDVGRSCRGFRLLDKLFQIIVPVEKCEAGGDGSLETEAGFEEDQLSSSSWWGYNLLGWKTWCRHNLDFIVSS